MDQKVEKVSFSPIPQKDSSFKKLAFSLIQKTHVSKLKFSIISTKMMKVVYCDGIFDMVFYVRLLVLLNYK